MAAPDSASRLDSEVINDSLHALVNIQTALGANPQGTFASLAARLQQFLPGGGTTPSAFTFVSSTTVSIPGTTHHLGSPVLLVQAYDQSTPRQAIEPDSLTIDQLTYDVTLAFTTAQSGLVSLAGSVPLYTTSFTTQPSVTILGSTHALGTAALLVRVYITSGTLNVLIQADVTVHPTTFDVTLTFATPETGMVVISAAGPRFVSTFTGQTTVTILGGAHGLASATLLYQLYDAATPRNVIQPDTMTVHPTTGDVVFTFATPQSGTVVLVSTATITGAEFDIRDGGITNANAVRIFSDTGALKMQMGGGTGAEILSPQGTVVLRVDNLGALSIAGSATKPGGGAWLSASDARLKDVLGPFTDGLDVLVQLEPVQYRYNGQGGIRRDGKTHVGLLAQAVQAIAGYMVSSRPGRLTSRDTTETDILVLDPNALTYLLLNSVKQLAGRVQQLEARLDAQETTT